MENYAHLNESGMVVNIIVADDDFLSGRSDKNFFIKADSDKFSDKPRASIGLFYDKNLDAFLPPKPYPSWILTSGYDWEPPHNNYPTGEGHYVWDENETGWVSSNEPTGIVLPSGWSDVLYGLTGGLVGIGAVELSGFDPKNPPPDMTVIPPPIIVPEFIIHISDFIPTGTPEQIWLKSKPS